MSFLTPVSRMPDALSPLAVVGRSAAGVLLRARLPLALTIGLVAGLAVWAALLPPDRNPPVPGDPDAVPLAWARSADRAPRLAWKTSAFAGVPETQERWSRMGPQGEETEDRLMLGDPGGSGPFALVLTTRVTALPTEGSFYLAAVRAAAKLGLVAGKMPQPESYGGRFGATELASATLSPISRAATARENCVAWRASAVPHGVSLIGFVCLPPPQRPDAAALECLLAGLSSADGTLRRLPETASCREQITTSTASRARTAVARARQ